MDSTENTFEYFQPRIHWNYTFVIVQYVCCMYRVWSYVARVLFSFYIWTGKIIFYIWIQKIVFLFTFGWEKYFLFSHPNVKRKNSGLTTQDYV